MVTATDRGGVEGHGMSSRRGIPAPNRNALNGMGEFLLTQVRRGASEQQWADWLKVPFEHACLAWDMSTIKRLLEAGVNGPYDRPRDPRFRRHTLLHLSSACGNTEVVNILLKWGSAPDVACREPGEKAYTPLHRAALGGHSEVARVLIKAGGDKNARTGGSGATPLHLSARRGHEECVRVLLLTGADKDARRALDGATPLHQAAFFGQMGAVRELLEAVADPNAQDAEGCTPVFLAAQEGHEEVVINLLQNGASPDICREDGWSPLHAAARFGHTSTVMALLREGRADFETPTGDHGSTPLHVAAISGFDEVVSVLMDLGSDLEALDSGGWTPLHCACAAARASCVNALLQRGADPSALTPEGQRPSSLIATDLAEGDEANEETNQMIVKMLRVPRAESEARRRRQAAKHAATSRPPPPYNNRPPPAYGPEVIGGVVFDSGGSGGGSGSGTGSVSGSYSGEGSRQHLRSPSEAKQVGGGGVVVRRGSGYSAPNGPGAGVGRGTKALSPRGGAPGGLKRQTSRAGSERLQEQMQSRPISYSFGSRESPPREDRPAETAAEWFAERRQEGEGVEDDDVAVVYSYNPEDNRVSTGAVVVYPVRRPGGGNNRGEMDNSNIGKEKTGNGGGGERVGNGNGGSVGNSSPAESVNTRGLASKKPRSPPESKKNQPERRLGPKVIARSRSATDFGSGKMGANNAALRQGLRSRSPSNARPKTDDSRPYLPATEAAFKRILARQQQQQQQEQQQMRAKSPMRSKVEGDGVEDVAVGAESAGGKNQSVARSGRHGGGGGGRNHQDEGLPRLLTRPSASLRAAAASGSAVGGPEGDGGRNNGDGNGDVIVEDNGGGGNRQILQHSYRRQLQHDGRRSSAGKLSGAFDSGISVIDVGGIPIGGAEDSAGGGSGSGGSGGGNGVESGSVIGAVEGISGDGSGSGGGVGNGGGSGNKGGSGGEIAAGSGIGGESIGGAGGGAGIGAFSSERADDGVGGGGTPPGTTVTVEADDLGNKCGSSGSSRVSMEGTKGIVARRLAAFDPFSFSKHDASSGRQDSKDKTYRTRF